MNIFKLFFIPVGNNNFDYNAPQMAASSSGSLFLKTLIVLIIIIPVIYLFIYLLKKYGTKKMFVGSKTDALEVIDRIVIAQNKEICLLRIKNKILILGIADGGINLIKEMDKKEFFSKGDIL